VIILMTGAEQAITAESPPKHRLLPGAIILTRVGREHQCNWPKSDCNHFWHGPRACILEANGFVAFANGADLAEVCKLWQFPPPPPSSSPHPSDPAGVGISPVAHDAKTGDTKSVPKQRPEDRSPPTNGTDPNLRTDSKAQSRQRRKQHHSPKIRDHGRRISNRG
jgi:hypothetical protein